MNEAMKTRLAQLEAEYAAGQKMLADLDAKRQATAATVLRIEGAMQVLREMLQPPDVPAAA